MNKKERYQQIPLWDSSLSEKQRLEYLLQELTMDEKFRCLGTGCPEITRLGIPAFRVGGEASHGVHARHENARDTSAPASTTMFPNPIGLSATWNRNLIKKVGAIIGTEARALYHAGRHSSLSLWAPTVDMERDPRWGRTEEGYGEDPYLAGEMAGAYVDGLQGSDAKYLRCGATVKHYYGNNVENGRTYISSSIDPRNKYEYYLEPFRKVIQEHHVEGLMTAYNEVNGVPCMLLKDDIQLAKNWGLGHVVCDSEDVSQTVNFHKYFHRHSETIAAGLKAGISCFTDNDKLVEEAAKEAFEREMITMEEVDHALYEHFRVMLRLGLFDREKRNPYTSVGIEYVSCEESKKTARQTTAESMVLLKNDGFLPLQKESVGNLAVVGPLSDTWYMDWYSGNPPYTVTPVDGLKEAGVIPKSMIAATGNSKVQICVNTEKKSAKEYLGVAEDGKSIGVVDQKDAETFIITDWGDGKVTLQAESNGLFLTTEDDGQKGQDGRITATKERAFGWFVKEIFYINEQGELCSWDQKKITIGEDQVLRKALSTDINAKAMVPELIVVEDGIATAVTVAQRADTVVLFLGANPVITCKEEIDRKHINLPDTQIELLKAVCKVNRNVVLVLISSVPYNLQEAQNAPEVRSILNCASGSMELGNGIADVLLGKVSVAGRLPMTWYASTEELSDINDYDIIQGGKTYQYYEGKALYPFGHGLTYSEMEYKNMTLLVEDQTLQVTAKIKNNGTYISDEVAQLYVHKKDSAVKRALLSLKGFERLKDIAPGEERFVKFVVPLEELKYYDVIAKEKLLEDGDYIIMLGCSSRDIRLKQEITLQGDKRPYRNGLVTQEAEYYDRAENILLHEGHLGYTAVCTGNTEQEVCLCYEKLYLEHSADNICIDFWQEYECQISIYINGRKVGKSEIIPPQSEQTQTLRAEQASGMGAFAAHQNWLTKHREIGFVQMNIPLTDIPCETEFTLEIRWRGKGKLCTFYFE